MTFKDFYEKKIIAGVFAFASMQSLVGYYLMYTYRGTPLDLSGQILWGTGFAVSSGLGLQMCKVVMDQQSEISDLVKKLYKKEED